MVTLHFNEPSFISSYSLQGELELPINGVVLLTGENGVGKSTLCSYLYEKHLLPGKTIWTESNQFRSIYPITVNSILEIYKENAVELDHERYQKLISLFKLSSWGDRTWSELSSGQGQMLKLLMGLSMTAQTYLLDEPAHFLDKEKLKILSQMITEISKDSLVMIIDHRIDWFEGLVTTHYQLNLHETFIKVEKQ
jgi:energy-coupling factor transporter ATP-binding protein EcfA2